MGDASCAIAADTKLETPEGGLTAKTLARKTAPVFTLENGRARFRMLSEASVVAESAPVVLVSLDTGASFRVGPDQIVFKSGMVECRAADLQVGDALVPPFAYAPGYVFRDDATGEERTSDGSVKVAAVEHGGEAPMYRFAVNVTGTFFVAAGVLCKAASS